MDTHGTMAGQMMTSRIEKWHWYYLYRQQTPFSRLTSSFATVHFILASCRVCIPSFSVLIRGSVRSGGCLSQTALRRRLFLTRWQQLQRKPEYRKELESTAHDWAKQIANFVEKRTTYQTITAHQKVKITWEWLIRKSLTCEYLTPLCQASANLNMRNPQI